MEKLKFVHKVSKGSRFNQIYIPRGMEESFQVGDTVQVILLEKKLSFHYSRNLPNLSEFKLSIIKGVFSELEKFKNIKQAFIFGSFLTKKSEYNDIDVLLIAEKEGLEKEVCFILTEKFELKFHVISIKEKNFNYLQKSCPLTRSMLYFFVSNKSYSVPKETEIDKEHIKFLLMMPQDLLNLRLNPKVFYDSIRRLVTIEKFLKKEDLNPLNIEEEIKNLIGEPIFKNIRLGEEMGDAIIKRLKKIIKIKLKKIDKKIR
ncbi:hypothetical protein A3K73_07880 [Candidatus Pacearchaeota archaeon RBG_13_36_9]|nr:MAG: hypothetical protein A3K73_07880 [Candidatus Pacearchaeota archaeon RBG_13_36_9]